MVIALASRAEPRTLSGEVEDDFIEEVFAFGQMEK